MDKAKGALDNKLNNDAQPGDAVEAKADNAANDSRSKQSNTILNYRDETWVDALLTPTLEVNNAANDVGVPQQDDGFIDKVADRKVNQDIPFGNN